MKKALKVLLDSNIIDSDLTSVERIKSGPIGQAKQEGKIELWTSEIFFFQTLGWVKTKNKRYDDIIRFLKEYCAKESFLGIAQKLFSPTSEPAKEILSYFEKDDSEIWNKHPWKKEKTCDVALVKYLYSGFKSKQRTIRKNASKEELESSFNEALRNMSNGILFPYPDAIRHFENSTGCRRAIVDCLCFDKLIELSVLFSIRKNEEEGTREKTFGVEFENVFRKEYDSKRRKLDDVSAEKTVSRLNDILSENISDKMESPYYKIYIKAFWKFLMNFWGNQEGFPEVDNDELSDLEYIIDAFDADVLLSNDEGTMRYIFNKVYEGTRKIMTLEELETAITKGAV